MSETESNLDLADLTKIPLPKGWPELTLQTVLHVIALARIILLNASVWPDGPRELRSLKSVKAENL